jgi:hypothetical protein
MTTAAIRLDIIQTIEKLKKQDLNELTGLIDNYLTAKYYHPNQTDLSEVQQKALIAAKKSIRANGGTEHSIAMNEFKNIIKDA